MIFSSPRLILASQSPRRRELLNQITGQFEIKPSSVEEVLLSDLSPEANALALARAKALSTAKKNPSSFVIGADTIVVLGNDIIGKPTNADDAYRILKTLSGRTHEVITGAAVVNPQGKYQDQACRSTVTFRSLSDEVIQDYVKTGEPLDKAGAYGIQGLGNTLIASYRGSYTNIVGLPLEILRELLVRSGYPI